MNILLSEDDRISALKLSRALERLGHSVETVGDGAEAWRKVCEAGVGLLITDWEMPEMDGPELCRRIRNRADAHYTYIILLTARDSRDDRLAGLEAGADDFLTKPVDACELVARLNIAQRILSMQEQLRAHAALLASLHAELARQNAVLAEQNARLAARATTDGLTGLKNRRHFDEALRSALAFANRHGQPLSLVLMDVDHFKAYNDQFGHLAGDDLLRTLAELLQDHARVHDLVARYGGEEFTLVLPATDASGARALAERLRHAIADHPWPLRPVTASFGIATTSAPDVEVCTLIAQADRALYTAKSRGRNCACQYGDLDPAGAEPTRLSRNCSSAHTA